MERALRKHLKLGAFTDVSESRSRAMSAVKGRGNRTTEVPFRMALVRAGIRGWCIHPRDIIGCPDFYFPRYRVAVFLDGCFWHGCPRCGHFPKTNGKFWKMKILRNRSRDAAKRAALRKEGVRVIRIWEHEIQRDLNKCIARVDGSLGGTTCKKIA